MSETALEKLLRLAGGITNSYSRTVNGKVERVSQYRSRMRRLAFGALKGGEILQIGSVQYKVIQARVPQAPYKPKQAGPNTKGTTSGKNTGSKGQAVNTKGGAAASGSGAGGTAVTAKTIETAVLGQPVPSGVATVTNELTDVRTGARYFVRLPPGTAVQVVG